MAGTVTGMPKILLRLEATVAVVIATAAYARLGSGWASVAALLLVPDLSAIGYLAGPRIGAASYNVAHFLGWPFAIIAWGAIVGIPMLVSIGLIWVVHIAGDRALGYGLKYPAGFSVTHLGRLGRPSADHGP